MVTAKALKDKITLPHLCSRLTLIKPLVCQQTPCAVLHSFVPAALLHDKMMAPTAAQNCLERVFTGRNLSWAPG